VQPGRPCSHVPAAGPSAKQTRSKTTKNCPQKAGHLRIVFVWHLGLLREAPRGTRSRPGGGAAACGERARSGGRQAGQRRTGPTALIVNRLIATRKAKAPSRPLRVAKPALRRLSAAQSPPRPENTNFQLHRATSETATVRNDCFASAAVRRCQKRNSHLDPFIWTSRKLYLYHTVRVETIQ
jgi:hypothetical protein